MYKFVIVALFCEIQQIQNFYNDKIVKLYWLISSWLTVSFRDFWPVVYFGVNSKRENQVHINQYNLTIV